MPPHLQLTLLNISPACDAQAVLPRPQHVILSHLYCQRGQVRMTDDVTQMDSRAGGRCCMPDLVLVFCAILMPVVRLFSPCTECERACGWHDTPLQEQIHHDSHVQAQTKAHCSAAPAFLNGSGLSKIRLCALVSTQPCTISRPQGYQSMRACTSTCEVPEKLDSCPVTVMTPHDSLLV